MRSDCCYRCNKVTTCNMRCDNLPDILETCITEGSEYCDKCSEFELDVTIGCCMYCMYNNICESIIQECTAFVDVGALSGDAIFIDQCAYHMNGSKCPSKCLRFINKTKVELLKSKRITRT